MEKLTQSLGCASINDTPKDILKDLSLPKDTTLVLPSCSSYYLKLNFRDVSCEKETLIEETLYHMNYCNLKKMVDSLCAKNY